MHVTTRGIKCPGGTAASRTAVRPRRPPGETAPPDPPGHVFVSRFPRALLRRLLAGEVVVEDAGGDREQRGDDDEGEEAAAGARDHGYTPICCTW